MNDYEYDPTVEAVEQIVCPRCEAKRKQPCITVNGEPTSPHVPRVDPLRIAYGEGFQDGERNARR